MTPALIQALLGATVALGLVTVVVLAMTREARRPGEPPDTSRGPWPG